MVSYTAQQQQTRIINKTTSLRQYRNTDENYERRIQTLWLKGRRIGRRREEDKQIQNTNTFI